MTNTQKAALRRVLRELEDLQNQVAQVQSEIDDYVADNADTLDGTARGEKLDAEIDALFEVDSSFGTLKEDLTMALTPV